MCWALCDTLPARGWAQGRLCVLQALNASVNVQLSPFALCSWEGLLLWGDDGCLWGVTVTVHKLVRHGASHASKVCGRIELFGLLILQPLNVVLEAHAPGLVLLVSCS
jgi:hypothetical protein